MSSPSLVKHSVVIAGHQTSISLEDEFWQALRTIAAANQQSLASLIGDIDSRRSQQNLSSALRVFVLRHAQQNSANTNGA
jgi:predicted DNA-binding ribbon-helix-helix protein